MGRLTHKLAATAFASLLAITPHISRAAQPVDLVFEFAQCAGRLSAQMEHQWLISNSGADRTKQHRAMMIALLEAVTDPAEAKKTLHLRIMTKHAHAQLLTQSIFSQDHAQKTYAQNRAQHLIAQCLSFLLGS